MSEQHQREIREREAGAEARETIEAQPAADDTDPRPLTAGDAGVVVSRLSNNRYLDITTPDPNAARIAQLEHGIGQHEQALLELRADRAGLQTASEDQRRSLRSAGLQQELDRMKRDLAA